jgi:hypothetical protein
MRLIVLLLTILGATSASAACKVVWVDHDYNTLTPAVQKQVCDSTLDLPAINLPGVRPIQQPKIKPIEPLALPPLGTTRCSTQQVWNQQAMRWEQKRICQ